MRLLTHLCTISTFESVNGPGSWYGWWDFAYKDSSPSDHTADFHNSAFKRNPHPFFPNTQDFCHTSLSSPILFIFLTFIPIIWPRNINRWMNLLDKDTNELKIKTWKSCNLTTLCTNIMICPHIKLDNISSALHPCHMPEISTKYLKHAKIRNMLRELHNIVSEWVTATNYTYNSALVTWMGKASFQNRKTKRGQNHFYIALSKLHYKIEDVT